MGMIRWVRVVKGVVCALMVLCVAAEVLGVGMAL